MALRLLPRAKLIKSSSIDHAAWNYDGLLGFVSRQRFRLVLSLLPARSEKLLEIGYGSGVFMPELARHTSQLFGIDIHGESSEVRSVLETVGVTATLATAPADRLPFDDASFDAVVVVSTFEFVDDITAAVREMSRVLRPGGCAIVVTPLETKMLDVALRVFTGESAEKDFGERRKSIVPTLMREMEHDRSAWFPTRFPVPVYRALRLRPRRRSELRPSDSVREPLATDVPAEAESPR